MIAHTSPLKRVVIAASVTLIAFMLGLIVGAGTAPVAEAAACQGAHTPPCGGQDGTRTAVAEVTHADTTGQSVVYVEPDSGESWSITAYWNTNVYPCDEYTETASVDVDWQTLAAAWGLSNKSTTINIVDIQVCSTGDCSTPSSGHGWGYRLFVDIDEVLIISSKYYTLRQVVFTTTAVDDGNQVDDRNCSLDDAVSPTSQSFSVTDSGSFECAYSCGSVSGPSLTITYE
jgi:hypothetical protein